MRKTFEIPLDIPDVTIQTVETDRNGAFVITVKSTVAGTYCHRCGKQITKVYGYDREITLRHLSILGRETYIRFIGKYLSRLRKLSHILARKERFETQLRAPCLPISFGMSTLSMTRQIRDGLLQRGIEPGFVPGLQGLDNVA